MKLIFTCEHGGNEVPTSYRSLFEGQDQVLQSHRGWDPGALGLAQLLSDKFKAPLFFSTTSRLLIELNRSLHHQQLFSEYTRSLRPEGREKLISDYYYPYRKEVEAAIAKFIGMGEKVIHISVHTFTPVLDGIIRETDLGILYDPARTFENAVAQTWISQIRMKKSFICRSNYPYAGTDDGFTTYLRTIFEDELYAGLELEVNQKFYLEVDRSAEINELLEDSLKAAISGMKKAGY